MAIIVMMTNTFRIPLRIPLDRKPKRREDPRGPSPSQGCHAPDRMPRTTREPRDVNEAKQLGILGADNHAPSSPNLTDREHRFVTSRSRVYSGDFPVMAAILVESTVLAIASSVIGLALAFGVLQILAPEPSRLPRLREITVDVPVLLFTLGIALFVSFAILIPAVKYTRDLRIALSGSGRGQSQSRERQRARKVLVAVQVALSLVLLICSGLMIRTFRALVNVDPGFARPGTLETFPVYIHEMQIPDTQKKQVVRREQEILETLASIPSVSSVAITNSVPMDGNGYIDPIFARDRTYREGDLPPVRRFKFISPGFFSTMGMPLIAGRDLTWTDTYEKRPIATVNRNLFGATLHLLFVLRERGPCHS